MWLGFWSRPHDDIDLSVLRSQWPDLAARLPSWLHPHIAQDGFLTSLDDESGTGRAANIWCFDNRTSCWGLQINLEDGDTDRWVYRRCPAVTAPWSQAVLSIDGLRIVAPEVQLLWKSKNPTPKDNADREILTPRLGPTAVRWLTQAIGIAHPGSPWN